MKGRLVALAFTSIVAFGACTKKEEHRKEVPVSDQLIVETKNTQGIYISSWQPASNISEQRTSADIEIKKSFGLPDAKILKEDVIMVFARNVWEEGSELKDLGDDQPLQMPFKFLPYFEKPGYTELWDYSISENKINVLLKKDGSVESRQPHNKMEVQFLVIPSELVIQKQQTKERLRHMSYDEVLKTFNLQA